MKRKPVGDARGWQDRMAGRIRFLSAVMILLLAAPVARAFYLQVLDRDSLKDQAASQSRMVVKVNPRRGPIIDRNGQPLAISVPVPSVYAYREQVTDKGRAASRLARALNVDRRTILKRLNKGRGFVWLDRKVSPDQADRVRDLELSGIGIQEESRRYYPNLDMAGPILGFVGTDGGLEGLENSLEDQLKGGGSYRELNRDARGGAYVPDGQWSDVPTVGATVQLTLDRTVQFFAEQALRDGCIAAGASGGTALILESATGRILAMASYPSFNPNDFSSFSQREYRNRAISFVFEPGSTFKVVTVAAALEEKVYDEMDIFFCENGRFQVADVVINDHLPHGWLTLKGIVQKSSNIGASKVGLELGNQRLWRYARDFGFGRKFDLLLPGESRGLLRKAEAWTVVDTANVSFGQSIAATPLQMAAAVNVVANGGQMTRPYLVEKITGSGGTVILSNRPEVMDRVVSGETADKVTRMMVAVTEKGGSGFRGAVPGYTVAGKTGTAQKYSVEEGMYSRDRFVASFIGFAPAFDPAVTAIVVVDEPKDDIYGGVVAAPIWSEMIGKTLNYLGVKPSLDQGEDSGQPLPEGTVLAQVGAKLPDDGGVSMPDLTGMTLREALTALSAVGQGIDVQGTGVVVSQDPAPGRSVDGRIRIGLTPRVKS